MLGSDDVWWWWGRTFDCNQTTQLEKDGANDGATERTNKVKVTKTLALALTPTISVIQKMSDQQQKNKQWRQGRPNFYTLLIML